MKKSTRYSAELRERAIRMFAEARDHYETEGGALRSVAEKLGCHRDTLKKWVLRAEGEDSNGAEQMTGGDKERLKQLEREVRELRQANEILRKASAFFAQAELDRRPK